VAVLEAVEVQSDIDERVSQEDYLYDGGSENGNADAREGATLQQEEALAREEELYKRVDALEAVSKRQR